MASRVQQMEPLWAALEPDRAKTLPGLHAFSGADNTGQFARIGKPTWLKLFIEAEDDVIDTLCMLCDDVDMSEDLQLTLAKFVCTAYHPKFIQLSSMPELRWHLFCKYMADSEKPPPTLGAFKQHILRARVLVEYWARLQFPSRNFSTPWRMATTVTAMTDNSSQPPLIPTST